VIRINTLIPVNTISCPRINTLGFAHKYSCPLITYMYLYIKTCSWLRLSVENLAGFRTAGWPNNGEFVLVAGKGGSPFF
jgi:hypothetical protein